MTPPPRETYADEFRRAATDMLTGEKIPVAGLARRPGVDAELVRRRKKRFAPATATPAANPAPPGAAEELKRLREENRQLRMEREILKKAAAFFAKEHSRSSRSFGPSGGLFRSASCAGCWTRRSVATTPGAGDPRALATVGALARLPRCGRFTPKSRGVTAARGCTPGRSPGGIGAA